VKRGKKNYIVLGILAILTIVGLSIGGIIPIKKISCESQFGPCRTQIEEALKAYQGENLRAAKKNISRMLASEVYIESFDIRFMLPSSLSVVVIEKKPVYALLDPEKQAIALVDKEGYIVAIEEATNLPTLVATGLVGGVGDRLSGQTLFGLEILSDMFGFWGVKQGILQETGLRVELEGGPKVIFPLEGDRAVLISSLRLIVSKLEAEKAARVGRPTIDLRFKNPVVTYE
jgi:hypothetical protein